MKVNEKQTITPCNNVFFATDDVFHDTSATETIYKIHFKKVVRVVLKISYYELASAWAVRLST